MESIKGFGDTAGAVPADTQQTKIEAEIKDIKRNIYIFASKQINENFTNIDGK